MVRSDEQGAEAGTRTVPDAGRHPGAAHSSAAGLRDLAEPGDLIGQLAGLAGDLGALARPR